MYCSADYACKKQSVKKSIIILKKSSKDNSPDALSRKIYPKNERFSSLKHFIGSIKTVARRERSPLVEQIFQFVTNLLLS
jgi:hypothetical protein